ncbi:SusC/RagA family TonB-linked outer membrane protein [Dinghuibacter silviterrae]|uniref:TonB-linked SusC/RagA family outer membrane protein n=1 Tax=Dinghuibacter silviterrae TaxID=1539049 RepID=A0A4R8DI61_9BACT|nr:TonB-dependent receptor [Dinghuibacter silviterrae]TDW97423.1 TonB-linked SusC/RagA family outer membrane protein [Dinghuibacter silviterrae]
MEKLKRFLLMKVCLLIALAVCFQVSAKGYSQETFSLHFRHAEVHEIFNVIQKESNYLFYYNDDYLKMLGRVNLDVTNTPLNSILNTLLGNKFTYAITDQHKVIISPVGDPIAIDTSEEVVKGRVTDDAGKPLGGVTVKVRGSEKGVVTDDNGNFTIRVTAGVQLVISSVGYKEQTVTASRNMVIKMQPNATGLADVLVVGYGTQKKSDVTGSISSVKGGDIANLPVSNAADAITGRAAGVDIVQTDGSPGSVPSIRVLGTGTINNADPLVVIDGVPSGGLNDVNPNDIASIEVLKDASASAIYGSRAANGVVLITTRKGNYDQGLRTTVNLYAGTKTPAKFLPMLSAPQLVQLKTEAYTNDGLSVPTVWSNPYYAVNRTNWQKALMGTGNVQNADVAVRGGNAHSNYSFSGNYFNENGMIVNSFFKRYSFRINSEHKIGSRLKLGENIVYSSTNGAAPNTQSTQTGLVWSAIRFNPAIPVVNPDGSWGTSQADNQLGDINNPVATAHEISKYNLIDRVLANAYAELEIINGLKLRANYGYDHNTNEYYEFDNAMPDQTRGPSIASLRQSFAKEKTLLEEYYLTYNHVFGEVHSLTLLAGYSAQVYSGNTFNASRTGFSDTSTDQRVLNLGNSSSASNGGYNYNPWGLQSYFVRGNYAFMNKYLLTATFRADGSSKFAPGKQWGYFPAFSAGWRLSDEHFWERLKRTVSMFKITGGWGQLGNQNVGDFQYLSIIGTGSGGGTGGGGYGYNLGTTTTNYNGAYITSLANPNITWERAVTTDVAVEFATLKNHLTGTVTWFNKNTSDMLIPYQIVETFGAQNNLPDDPGNITLPDYNIGTLNNRGVEIELNYQDRVGDFTYSVGGNATFIKNKITKLYGSDTYLASTPYGRENTDISRTYEGQPIASFYGFKTAGLYQTQAQINSDPYIANDPNKPNIKPGDVRFVDVNGDGVVDDNDRVRLGDPNPRFVFGFHGSGSYMHFDIAFNFTGATGFKLYDADRLSGLDATQVYNWYADQQNRWHGEGTSNSVPRLSIDNLNNNYRSSDLWVYKGNYITLRSLALGYTIPKVTLSTWKLPEVRFYVSAYNLFTITKYPGYTPELGYTDGNLQRGVDVAQYPATRTYMVGATVNLQ